MASSLVNNLDIVRQYAIYSFDRILRKVNGGSEILGNTRPKVHCYISSAGYPDETLIVRVTAIAYKEKFSNDFLVPPDLVFRGSSPYISDLQRNCVEQGLEDSIKR